MYYKAVTIVQRPGGKMTQRDGYGKTKALALKQSTAGLSSKFEIISTVYAPSDLAHKFQTNG